MHGDIIRLPDLPIVLGDLGDIGHLFQFEVQWRFPPLILLAAQCERVLDLAGQAMKDLLRRAAQEIISEPIWQILQHSNNGGKTPVERVKITREYHVDDREELDL